MKGLGRKGGGCLKSLLSTLVKNKSFWQCSCVESHYMKKGFEEKERVCVSREKGEERMSWNRTEKGRIKRLWPFDFLALSLFSLLLKTLGFFYIIDSYTAGLGSYHDIKIFILFTLIRNSY